MYNGVMLPNTEWEPWTTMDAGYLADLQPTCLLVPVYDSHNPHNDARRQFVTAVLRSLPQGTKVLYRMMAQDAMTFDPVQWAIEVTARMQGAWPDGEWIVTNEDNLEGAREDWRAMVVWWQRFMAALGPKSSLVHLSALAPVGNYQQGWRALSVIAPLFAAVDVHCYQGSLNDVQTIKSVMQTTRPIFVTEYNGVQPQDFASIVNGNAVGMVWFLLRGTPDQAQYNLIGSPYYDGVKAVNKMYPMQFPVPYGGGSGAGGAGGSQPPPLPPSDPTPATAIRRYSRLADISNVNGHADVALMAQFVDGLIFKAMEGRTYKDRYFQEYWSIARDLDLPRAAYMFGRPSSSGARGGRDEALALLDFVKPKKGEVVVLDIEDDLVASTADLLAYLVDFIQTITAEWALPMVYSGDYYLRPHNLEGSDEAHQLLGACGLYYAAWGPTPPRTVPKPWEFWALWQQADDGRLPGVQGVVDIDYFNGPIDHFVLYGKAS